MEEETGWRLNRLSGMPRPLWVGLETLAFGNGGRERGGKYKKNIVHQLPDSMRMAWHQLHRRGVRWTQPRTRLQVADAAFQCHTLLLPLLGYLDYSSTDCRVLAGWWERVRVWKCESVSVRM